MTPVSPVGGEVDDLDRELAMVWMAETKGEFLTAAAVVRARLEAAESARDEAVAVVRDLLATLDRGAYRFEEVHVRADLNALRAVLTPSAPTEEER